MTDITYSHMLFPHDIDSYNLIFHLPARPPRNGGPDEAHGPTSYSQPSRSQAGTWEGKALFGLRCGRSLGCAFAVGDPPRTGCIFKRQSEWGRGGLPRPSRVGAAARRRGEGRGQGRMPTILHQGRASGRTVVGGRGGEKRIADRGTTGGHVSRQSLAGVGLAFAAKSGWVMHSGWFGAWRRCGVGR